MVTSRTGERWQEARAQAERENLARPGATGGATRGGERCAARRGNWKRRKVLQPSVTGVQGLAAVVAHGDRNAEERERQGRLGFEEVREEKEV